MNTNIKTYTHYFGYAGLIISTILYIIYENADFNVYIVYAFLISTVLTIIGKLATIRQYEGMYQQRIKRLTFFGTISLAAAVYFMLEKNNAWAICLFVYAFCDLFATFIKPKEK